VLVYATALEEPVKEVESVALLVSRPSFPVDPPVFTQIFGNGTADVGGRLVFDCIINGCPVPNVRQLLLSSFYFSKFFLFNQ
jgi:hypothetical protein